MVIRKGEPWGSPGDRPHDLRVVTSDAAAARAVAEGARTLGLEAGDMLRTVGGNAPPGGEHQHLPLDFCWVTVDDDVRLPCFAHVVARHRLWRGEGAAVMNAAWLGPLYLGPKAHPNDGLVDVTTGALPLGQRIQARRRATNGTHLPHPALTSVRTAGWQGSFDRPIPIWIDGQLAARGRQIVVDVEPDAITLII